MPVVVPTTLAQVGDLVDESIQNIFVKRREQVPPDMPKIFNETVSSSYYNKDSSMVGSTRATFVGDNASVEYDGLLQGFDKTYTSKKYARGMKISHHAWKFGVDLRKVARDSEGLVDAVNEQIDTCAFDMLNNGYSTSYTDDDSQTVSTSGGDSAAFFSSSHTREDGGTAWNNTVYDGTTYNMDFEYDALKALRKTAALVKTGRGSLMGVEPDTMVCKFGSSVHDRYEEIMGAISRSYIPGGNENDGAAKVGLPKLITSKYLDNDAYYFTFDSSMKNDKYGLQWIWAEKPVLLAPEHDYDSQEYRRQVYMFFDRGANDMRGWQASKGTNAA